MSAHIGIHTILIVELINAPNPDFTVLTKIVVDEILRSAEHCLDEYNSPEDEILYGTAGYLYALNLIAAKLKPHTKSCDVLVLELHKMIEKIVHKLAD